MFLILHHFGDRELEKDTHNELGIYMLVHAAMFKLEDSYSVYSFITL